MRKLPLSSAKREEDSRPTFSIGVLPSRLRSCKRRLEGRLGRTSAIAPEGSLQTHLYEGIFEGSLEVKLPTIWTDEKESREEAERREILEERKVDR